MSSGAGNSFGTNSPPLSATNSDDYMGVSGISGKKPDVVPDAEQRKDYFKGSAAEEASGTEIQSDKNAAPSEKIKKD